LLDSSFRTIIGRYPKVRGIITRLDPFTDATLWVQAFCAKEYMIDVLRTVHGHAPDEARSRQRAIYPHLRLALDYIAQSQQSKPESSFLPAYYAVLNLMKIYILTGPLSAELQVNRNRHHGLTYITQENRQSPLQERVKLNSRGATLLFYRTVTGEVPPGGTSKGYPAIKMGSVYPYLRSIEAELLLAGVNFSRLHWIGTYETHQPNRGLNLWARPSDGSINRKYNLKPLTYGGFARGGANFLTLPLPQGQVDVAQHARQYVRTHLLYDVIHANTVYTQAPLGRKLHLFEEFPIVLLFFHLGNVARYNPELLYRIADSKFWPAFASSRTHTLLRFLELFCSYMTQTTTYFAVG
jgi:hypothetical protein